MIPEIDNVPSPLDDSDDGYGDEEAVSELTASGPLDPTAVTRVVGKIHQRQRDAEEEMRSGSDYTNNSGEAGESDDDTPDPEDFFRPGGPGSC